MQVIYVFETGGSTPRNKRQRQELDTDGDEHLSPTDPEMDLDTEMERDDETAAEDEYVAPRKPKAPAKGKGKARGPPAPKKPRATKAAAKVTPRKGKKKADGSAFDVAKVSHETKISDDNALFSACLRIYGHLKAHLTS